MSAPAQRKVWVRRPGASATLVAFNETDVVDDVREMLLRKYGNSLGRVYDAPDVTLRLIPRESHQGERTLAPDDLMTRTLDVYYPGGQTIDEALVIDVPTVRRATPNGSPRGGPPHAYHLASVHRDTGHHNYSSHSNIPPDYFGPGVVPDYYNHGALTAESEYSNATLAPESALAGGVRVAPSSQHLYPPSPGHHHKAHGNSGGMIRSPTGAGASGSVVQSAAGGGGGGGSTGNSPLNHPHSISIIATGQVPPIPNLPSPGGSSRRSHKDRSDRPKLNRQISTADDGSGVSQINGTASGSGSGQKGQGSSSLKIPVAAPIANKAGSRTGSTPDAINQKSKGSSAGDLGVDKDGGKNGALLNGSVNGSNGASSARSVTSPPRTMSPMRGKRAKKAAAARAQNNNVNSSGNGAGVNNDERNGNEIVQLGPLTVPPINVLIVEDNIINLKLLEAFVKRLKVRWQTAMNGRDAVAKWRTGGFHLVLMDIQLPLMSGLDATREIRRLERVNSIGVFASTPSDSIGVGRDPQSDKLANLSLFKSPVIIVALTASSLQSDRNDALAAGCNDFLTKPVNFLWLEKKIMEWGCMQALIDFDGWRKWKEQKPSPAPASQQQHPDGGNGDASGDTPSTKKSKKSSSGHAKRPSMSSANREKAESSDTTNTVSSTESPSAASGHARQNSNGVQARSPLSKPSISERLAAATAAVESDQAALGTEKPQK